MPPRIRAALVGRGAARIVGPERHGDQFVLLTDPALYRSDTGPNWADPTFIGAAALIA